MNLQKHKIKIVIVAGARPNFMKIGPLHNEIVKHYEQITPFLIHTGQHYDLNMSDKIIKDLNLPNPDIFLGIGSGSHAEQTAKIMIEFEKVCMDINPNIVVVVGDVNSTMACSITAKKLLIRVAHVEAGLRSRDITMPEEINRIITDVTSDYLFTPTKEASKNLRNEGICKKKIYFVGNIMIDSLKSSILRASEKETYKNLNLSQNKYGLVTLHRPSNVDYNDKLIFIINLLNSIGKNIPIIFPMHPRTSKNLKLNSLSKELVSLNNLNIIEPLGYLDFLNLMMNAKFVLTDSGGIQEETTYLGIPCLTLRENTERPITVRQGTNELVKPVELKDKVFMILRGKWKKGTIPKYWDGKTAKRIMNVLFEKVN